MRRRLILLLLISILTELLEARSPYVRCFQRIASRSIDNAQPMFELYYATPHQCIDQCTYASNNNFPYAKLCRSFVYDYSRRSCRLYDHQGNQPPAILHPAEGYDFYKRTAVLNQCSGPVLPASSSGPLNFAESPSNPNLYAMKVTSTGSQPWHSQVHGVTSHQRATHKGNIEERPPPVAVVESDSTVKKTSVNDRGDERPSETQEEEEEDVWASASDGADAQSIPRARGLKKTSAQLESDRYDNERNEEDERDESARSLVNQKPSGQRSWTDNENDNENSLTRNLKPGFEQEKESNWNPFDREFDSPQGRRRGSALDNQKLPLRRRLDSDEAINEDAPRIAARHSTELRRKECPTATAYYVMIENELITPVWSNQNDVAVLHGVTQSECTRLCSSNKGASGERIECSSTNYFPLTRKCELFNSMAEPHGSGSLVENEEVVYTEKFCLPVKTPNCEEDEMFILYPQKKLGSRALATKTTRSLTSCLQHCLIADSCKSAAFDSRNSRCHLHAVNLADEPTMLLEATSSWTVVENGCSLRSSHQQLPRKENRRWRGNTWTEWTDCIYKSKGQLVRVRMRQCETECPDGGLQVEPCY